MPNKNEMSIVGIALYDTFCGRFHPDEWEELQDEFWKQVEAAQLRVNSDSAEGAPKYTGLVETHRCKCVVVEK